MYGTPPKLGVVATSNSGIRAFVAAGRIRSIVLIGCVSCESVGFFKCLDQDHVPPARTLHNWYVNIYIYYDDS
jgi:hypothetical protein